MAIRNKNGEDFKAAQVFKTEKDYDCLALNAARKNLITLTEKQASSLEYLERFNFIELNKKGVAILSDSNLSKLKAPIMTAGLPQSPIKNMNDSAKKLMEAIYTRGILEGIMERRLGRTAIYTDMLTLSIANVGIVEDDFGEPRKGAFELKEMFHRLIKFCFETFDFTKSHLIGVIPHFEITYNTEAIENEDYTNLFHVHIHVILLFDMPTNVRYMRRELYKKWEKLAKKTGRKVSRMAFGYEHAYSHDEYDGNEQLAANATNNNSKPQRPTSDEELISAFVEAMKYPTNPKLYNMLAAKKKKKKRKKNDNNDNDCEFSDYYLRVFAETYNIFVRQPNDEHVYEGFLEKYKNTWKFRLQAAGMYKDALFYTHRIHDAGLYTTTAIQEADKTGQIPSVLTQVQLYHQKINRNTGHIDAYFTDTQKLTDPEIIYYNKILLKNVYASKYSFGSLKSRLQKKYGIDNITANDRQRELLWLLENHLHIQKSAGEVIAIFQNWQAVYQSEIRSLNAEKRKAMSENNLKGIAAADSEIAETKNKLDDVTRLLHAFSWATSEKQQYGNSQVRVFKRFNEAPKIQKMAQEHGLTASDLQTIQDGSILKKDSKIWDFLEDYVRLETGKPFVDTQKRMEEEKKKDVLINSINSREYWKTPLNEDKRAAFVGNKSIQKLARKRNITDEELSFIKQGCLLKNDVKIWNFLEYYVISKTGKPFIEHQKKKNKMAEGKEEKPNEYSMNCREFWVSGYNDYKREVLVKTIVNDKDYMYDHKSVRLNKDSGDAARSFNAMAKIISEINPTRKEKKMQLRAA